MDLGALNRTSAKIATFPVRLIGVHQESYTYNSKKNGETITAHKFEVCMVGLKSTSYCMGFVKGSSSAVKEAQRKFADGSMWALSKVSFDTYTQAQYISTPGTFRVDLSRSTLETSTFSGVAQPAEYAVPPRTVAETVKITTNRSTDLLAVIKSVGSERKSKSDHDIADVTLIDDSKSSEGTIATITVSVFGGEKIRVLKANVGKPMVFFSLSVTSSGGSISVTHYDRQILAAAPPSEKTTALQENIEQLISTENVASLTSAWAPVGAKDVSGPQPLSCAAFLDFTSEAPSALMPDVVQLMWVHIEEPDVDTKVLDPKTESRIWFRTHVRDSSGSVEVGIGEKAALTLASVASKDAFLEKHQDGNLGFPLLCHVRISRNTRERSGGAGQPAVYVNHTVETIETVAWNPESAPNESYVNVLGILNNCPPHSEGIMFGFLRDIQSDPFYGFRLEYDGTPAPPCVYALVLVGSVNRSSTEKIGENGYKVVTKKMVDTADLVADGAAQPIEPEIAALGFCTLDSLPGFRLDPPRGKAIRHAVCLITRKDDEGLCVHKLEYIEPEQVNAAVLCLQKLRMLCMKIRPHSLEKRTHSLQLESPSGSPMTVKKARSLRALPTGPSLD